MWVLQQTHSLIAVMFLHAYCNIMGPPDIKKGKADIMQKMCGGMWRALLLFLSTSSLFIDIAMLDGDNSTNV